MSHTDPFRHPVWAGVEPQEYQSSISKIKVVDLCVVGAGILGLVTAFNAARAGRSVCVIDACQIGQGASGLNGGQVIPGLKFSADEIISHLGVERGERLVAFANTTADRVFQLIQREGLKIPFTRNGWIQAALTPAAVATAKTRVAQLQRRGADVAVLDQAEVGALTGAQGYLGGWIDRRAGVIDPLAYVQELARIASSSGVQIVENNKANRLSFENQAWTVETAAGAIKAKQVLLATNAYTDGLIPKLAQSLVPLHSFQIATAPLPDELGRSILPEGQAVSDSRRVLAYYRRSPDGRLVLGGRGKMGLPHSPSDWNHLTRTMLRLFPQLANTSIEQRWFGRVAMTADHWPHLHQPEPGLWAFVGCQGRGVALMTAMGERLGGYFANGDMSQLPFPVTPIRTIPFHRLHKIAVAATITAYRTLDGLGL